MGTLFQEELAVYKALDLEIHCEELILKDQSGLKWLKCGDHNTAFFHHLLSARKVSKNIYAFNISGCVTTDVDVNRSHVFFIFTLLYFRVLLILRWIQI